MWKTKIDSVLKIPLLLVITTNTIVGGSLQNLDKPMSPLETFFAFGFVSTFAVVLLATLWYYLPTLTALYTILIQPNLESDRTMTMRERKA